MLEVILWVISIFLLASIIILTFKKIISRVCDVTISFLCVCIVILMLIVSGLVVSVFSICGSLMCLCRYIIDFWKGVWNCAADGIRYFRNGRN